MDWRRPASRLRRRRSNSRLVQQCFRGASAFSIPVLNLHQSQRPPSSCSLVSLPVSVNRMRVNPAVTRASAPLAKGSGNLLTLSITAQVHKAACCPNFAGKPEPLGPSKTASGVNFALFSRHAKSVKLCIFDTEAQQLAEVDCNRTGRCRSRGVAREHPPGSVGLGRWAFQQAKNRRSCVSNGSELCNYKRSMLSGTPANP